MGHGYVFAAFILMKNHKIANDSTTTEACKKEAQIRNF
jgi:hypothetical protein